MVEEKIPTSKMHFTEYLINKNVNSLFLKPVDELEVLEMVNGINVSKASGPNSIPNKLLKTNALLLLKPLTFLLNLSILEGNFPQLLKLADVCPIYKKNDKNKCENYRPISLLSNLSKLYERVMHTRLYDFLENTNLIYDLQFGFRKKHSTNHAILSIIEDIRQDLDNKTFTCGVFIDLEKAFDTVNHKILLEKLKHYGVRGIANQWFESYLSNRKQRVKFNGEKSNYLNVTCGVPQGSILGPLLFLVYINDMHQAVKYSKMHHFADDTYLKCSDKNDKLLRNKMNKDLALLFDWLCANRLSLNVSKTEFIVFKPPNKTLTSRFTLKLNRTVLYESKKIKYLGLIVDDRLTWKFHVFELRKKLNRVIGIIYRLQKLSCPRSVLLSIYYTLFQSHAMYGICVWGTATNKYLEEIRLVQKKAIRIISNANYTQHTRPLFKELNLLNIDDLFQNQYAALMWDQDHGLLPKCFDSYFTKVRNIHRYDTRSASNDLISESTKINTDTHGKSMFRYQGAKIANQIKKLNFYKDCKSKNIFRKKHKKHLLELY